MIRLSFRRGTNLLFGEIHPLQLTTGRVFEGNSCQTQLIWLIEYWIILRSCCIPSLKLARSWKWLGRRLFPFGAKGLFSGANLLLFFKEANFPDFFPPAKLTSQWKINNLKMYFLPIPSMYGIFTSIYHINQRKNVGKYTSPMDSMGIERWGFSSDRHVTTDFGGGVFWISEVETSTVRGVRVHQPQVVVNYVPLVSKSKNF